MTAVLGEPLLFASNTPLSFFFLVFLLDVIFFYPVFCRKMQLEGGCQPRLLSFGIINDIDSQRVEAPDCLCANEVKSEQQHLDPQPIHQELHGLY